MGCVFREKLLKKKKFLKKERKSLETKARKNEPRIQLISRRDKMHDTYRILEMTDGFLKMREQPVSLGHCYWPLFQSAIGKSGQPGRAVLQTACDWRHSAMGRGNLPALESTDTLGVGQRKTPALGGGLG